MKRGPSGQWVACAWAGRPAQAFVPDPHPPALVLQGGLPDVLRRAHLALGRLDAAAAQLPSPTRLLDVCLRREALWSCQLAGRRLSLGELLLAEIGAPGEAAAPEARSALDAVGAFERGWRRVRQGAPWSIERLCELHAALAPGRGPDDAGAGALRHGQHADRPWSEDEDHLPPPGPHVAECTTALERFLERPAGHGGALAKTALAHAWFEAIQPFPSGNGRLGRLLVSLLLGSQGLLREPLLAPSQWLVRHRERYYALLRGVRHEGDWEAWLAFFAEGVRETARSSADTLVALAARFADDRAQIRIEIDSPEPALRVHRALERRPVLTAARAAKQTNLPLTTAAAALEAIEKLGVARALGVDPRSRAYGYRGALALLGEVGGPFAERAGAPMG